MNIIYLFIGVFLSVAIIRFSEKTIRIIISVLKNTPSLFKKEEKKYYFRGEEIVEPKPEELAGVFEYSNNVIIYPHSKKETVITPVCSLANQWTQFKGKHYKFITEAFIKDNFLSQKAA